jgi:hypothetical protein
MIWGKQTYLLTPYSTVLIEKLTGLQLVKKFPAFYGTRRIPEQYSAEYNPMYQLLYDQAVKPRPTKPPDLHPQTQVQ